jgi:phosphatidylinositol-3-phosphatase
MRLRRSVPATLLLGALAVLPWGVSPAAATSEDAQVPSFNGPVFLIIGENTQLSQLNLGNAPYMLGKLKPSSAWLTNYWATTHYSEANYAAMTSGDFTTCEQKDGKVTACHQDIDNLFNQIAMKGKTFLTWSESMPKPCYLFNTGNDSDQNHYAAKHNPQLLYDNVEGDTLTQPGHGTYVVNTDNTGGNYCKSTNVSMGGDGTLPNETTLFDDVLAGNAPAGSPSIADFNLVVPNECQDGHSNCKPQGNEITQFDDFLALEVPRIQDYITAHGGLLIVTFDEGVTSSPKRAVKFGNGGNVMFAAWGPQVNTGVYDQGPFTHYSLLRTLEDGFGISNYLGHAIDFEVHPIYPIWK